MGLPWAALRFVRSHWTSPDGIQLAWLEGPKGHLSTKWHLFWKPGRVAIRGPPAPHTKAHYPELAKRSLPARGESGSPLTAPTTRHWKSFRTSSQVSTPSLGVDPKRAKRRRQRKPTLQVCASIIGVPVIPFPQWTPLSPRAGRCRHWKKIGGRGSQWVRSETRAARLHSDSGFTWEHLAFSWEAPRLRHEFSGWAPPGVCLWRGELMLSGRREH
jgi:hypothetical protein